MLALLHSLLIVVGALAPFAVALPRPDAGNPPIRADAATLRDALPDPAGRTLKGRFLHVTGNG